MNLLVPPLMASVLLAGYVATVSFDRTDGDERRYAADSMVRYHTQAIEVYDPLNPVASLQNVSIAPFAAVLNWQSQEAFDNNNRRWVITYMASDRASQPTTIGDVAVSSITYELARTDFSGGTYGIWNGNVLTSTLGNIPFTSVPRGRPAPPVVPNGTPVIATLF